MSRLTNRVKCNVATIVLKMLGIEDVPTESVEIIKTDSEPCDSVCEQYEYECSECPINEAFVKLAHYEDLEEQGKLIELPCAVGDTVWLIGKNYKKCTNHYDCEHYDYNEYLITWCEKNCPNGFRGTGVIQAIIETIEINGEQVLVQLNAHDNYLRVPITSVFLTKEAAEAKLAEMEGAENDS